MPTPARKAQSLKGTARAGVRPARTDPEAGKLAAALAALREATEQQKATTEILRVVAKAPQDSDAIFKAITAAGRRLMPEMRVALSLVHGGQLHYVAHSGIAKARRLAVAKFFPMPVDRKTVLGAAILNKRVTIVPDMRTAAACRRYTRSARTSVASGWRSMLAIPLVRDGAAIGALGVTRAENGSFTPRQIAIAQMFADQAVIAIENARLFNETKGALARQTATSDVLGVIAASPSHVQPVLDAVAERAASICGADHSAVWLADGKVLRRRAWSGRSGGIPEDLVPRRTLVTGRAFLEKRAIAVGDIVPLLDTEYPDARPYHARLRWRALVAVPLILKGEAIGTLNAWRREPRAFSGEEIRLLETFADQAVIAIENARLFNETKEALEQQTATSEVLKTISRSTFDLQAVLQVLIENATRLAGANQGFIFRFDGQVARLAFSHNAAPAYRELMEANPIPPGRGTLVARTLLERRAVHIPDVLADKEYTWHEAQRLGGFRSMLGVPMMREGTLIGVIAMWSDQLKPFTDRQIALVSTFADQAVIAIENVRLFNETKEALDRQTATAEILKVIARSPADVQPVFETIAASAHKLCNARYAAVTRRVDDMLHLVAHTATTGIAHLESLFPAKLTGQGAIGKAVLAAKPAWISDIETDPNYSEAFRAGARERGYRSQLTVPMLRKGEAIGAITVTRPQAGEFPRQEIELLQTFADQAVIAIENVRLFNETRESLEQQTAAAEILRVISRSTTDVQPVFDAIAQSAARLVPNCNVGINMLAADGIHVRAIAGPRVAEIDLEEAKKHYPLPNDPQRSLAARAIAECGVIEIADTEAAGVSPLARDLGRQWKYRAVTIVPLVREGQGIGMIALTHPSPGFKLSEKQLALIRTFAAQAVIAIENVRLFNETKEALERQTATGEILQVISSSTTEAQPVFDAIVRTAVRLFGTSVVMRLANGDRLERVAQLYPGQEEIIRGASTKLDESSFSGRAILRCEILHMPDMEAEAWVSAETRALQRAGGFRSGVFVPMLREGAGIGALGLMRAGTGAFDDKTIGLLKTFADQAVIAIENSRLFNETKEALEHQTATSGILGVISSSPTDTGPVFEAIAQSAVKLFAGTNVSVLRREGDMVHIAAQAHLDPERARRNREFFPIRLDRGYLTGRVILDGQVVDINDVGKMEPSLAPSAQLLGKLGYQAITVAPMMSGGVGIGAISVGRGTPGKLSEKQIALLKTFASQAVIAIENVRLFNETKESLEQQTAIGEVLRVISSSPTDVKPILDTVAARAAKICEASDARIHLVEGDEARYVAGFGDVPLGFELGHKFALQGSVVGRSILGRAPVHIEDLAAAPEAEFPVSRALQQRTGHRTMLAVPLLREDRALGAIVLRRMEVRPFSDKQIALLKVFADQAAIAIENVRLFNETREALDQQKASAEVLAAISSSIADTGPVFQKIVESCARLFEGHYVGIGLVGEDGYIHPAAYHGPQQEEFEKAYPVPLSEESGMGRAILARDVVLFPEVLHAAGVPSYLRRAAETFGGRSMMVAPMLWEGRGIGGIFVARAFAGPFAEKSVRQLKTFADQAVIAIQNARLFREIQEKSRQLEEASKHKSQFLASMSHELRTPLNAILGFNEMILGGIYGDVPGDMTEPLKDMQTSGKHLLRLINNVLDLAKIEAGRMELALGDYSVQDTVAGVQATLRPLAAEKGLEFVAEVPPEIPLAHGDGGRITQCLMNLAGNSLKFTKSGRVAIAVQQENGMLRYSVTDTGIGIPADKIGSLFTEFKQTDATIASEFGGTGLGLSITKKFIEMHGGRIWVESEPGKGSAFRFEVPLRVGT